MKRLSRGLSGGGTACRILAILSYTVPVPGKEDFLHCFQLVQKIFCQSYLKFYCSTRIWTLNWNCIARHCPWAYLAEILPPVCPNGFWSSNPWIQIRIRIHLKCWIHSSVVVDPWHFGIDPDPEPRIRTTDTDPAFRHWLTRWQQKIFVFFHIFSLIAFCRYPVHLHPFYKSQNNKNQGFCLLLAGSDSVQNATMIFYVKEILSGGSVADPWHFGVDPDPDLDPRIHASD